MQSCETCTFVHKNMVSFWKVDDARYLGTNYWVHIQCELCVDVFSTLLSAHTCLWCLYALVCDVCLKFINGYCPRDHREIAARWKRFSLPCRLNIGFSKKSIKGLIIKVNKYSLPSKLFQDLHFPITTVALLLFTVLCWHTHIPTACNVLYETERGACGESCQ